MVLRIRAWVESGEHKMTFTNEVDEVIYSGTIPEFVVQPYTTYTMARRIHTSELLEECAQTNSAKAREDGACRVLRGHI